MKTFMIDKTKLNLIIDIIMLILMMPVAGIGFLMKFILLPGLKRNELYGPDVDLHFLGLDRHEWGTIHLILSLALLGFLVLHIIFHWKMVIVMFKRLLPVKSIRKGWVVFIIIVSVILISFPLFVKPELVPRESARRYRQFPGWINDRHSDELRQEYGRGRMQDEGGRRWIEQQRDYGRGRIQDGRGRQWIEQRPGPGRGWALDNQQRQITDPKNKDYQQEYAEIEIFGYETLQSVADRYNVPVSVIAEDLNIPIVLADRRLGWLSRQYDFTINDIRKSISEYKKK